MNTPELSFNLKLSAVLAGSLGTQDLRRLELEVFRAIEEATAMTVECCALTLESLFSHAQAEQRSVTRADVLGAVRSIVPAIEGKACKISSVSKAGST